MTVYEASCDCGYRRRHTSQAKAEYGLRQHSCEKWRARTAAKARGEAREAAVDRTPKPCHHKRANHQHGTRACYVLDACRCIPCSRANAKAETDRERQKAYGRYDRYVPASQARAYVLNLMDQGMGLKRIVAVSGVPQGTLWKLVYGKRQPDGTQQRSRRVTRDTHHRIMAVQVDLAAGARVRSIGTHRRVQALVAIGWSQSKIAERLGVGRGNFGNMMTAPAVTRRTHDAMVAIYDEWSMRLPPEETHRDKIAASRARKHAKIHRWAPPLAWDDDALDDPDAKPNSRIDVDDELDEAAILRRMAGDLNVRTTKAEKAEIVRRLRAAGVTDKDIERRTGINALRHVPRHRDLPQKAS